MRAEGCILEARAAGYVHLGALFRALRELTDDPPTATHARELAGVLGCLTPEEYRDLLHQSQDELQRASASAVASAERTLAERTLALSSDTENRESEPIRLADLREGASWDGTPIAQFSLVLQALVWAVAPPSKPERFIVY